MNRPVFADPRTGFVFKKLFGSEERKDLIIALLNGPLELDEAHLIVELELLSPEQRPPVTELKYSIVDVKCRDARGVWYVVEMQVLNVEGFEKRVVYDVPKVSSRQLGKAGHHAETNDVIGISICEFEVWPSKEGFDVPMLSRWPMPERCDRQEGRGRIELVFLELPKLERERPPQTTIEKWAYFFGQADNLVTVPEVLAQSPLLDALEAVRTAGFTDGEWEAYERAGIALQDKRGALSLAYKRGREEGRQRGQEEAALEVVAPAVLAVLAGRGIEVTAPVRATILGTTDLEVLRRWLALAITVVSAEDVIRG